MAAGNIGLLFRSYAKKPEGVDEVVTRAVESARRAEAEGVKNVIFIVPTDYDCGVTPSRLLEEGLNVLEARGHHSSGVLNAGLELLKVYGVKYAGIVSNKAVGMLNASLLQVAEQFLDSGEFCVGLQIQELEDVQEIPITNTCAFWNIDKLLSVGGFDSETGVEEITALVRLMCKFGHGTTSVVATGGEKLNVRKSADGQARHSVVKETKRVRQESEAARMGVKLSWISCGIKTV